jgi:DNA-binding MarR family transcriptional regulator
MVSGMERDGLLRRDADPRDGRVVRVTATARGADLLHRGREARVRELATALDKLPSKDLATLGRAADILRSMEKT